MYIHNLYPIYIFISIYIYIYINMYICIYRFIFICNIYLHTHTNTYTYTRSPCCQNIHIRIVIHMTWKSMCLSIYPSIHPSIWIHTCNFVHTCMYTYELFNTVIHIWVHNAYIQMHLINFRIRCSSPASGLGNTSALHRASHSLRKI